MDIGTHVYVCAGHRHSHKHGHRHTLGRHRHTCKAPDTDVDSDTHVDANIATTSRHTHMQVRRHMHTTNICRHIHKSTLGNTSPFFSWLASLSVLPSFSSWTFFLCPCDKAKCFSVIRIYKCMYR